MKVCGKKDIHVPGCDDCSELEERVEAVEECCDDAHEEIDTLNTDKADKDYVDDSIETVNQTIVDVADTLGERIDNVITASEPSVTTLWEGVMESIGDSANLSEDVNDFDYLDIYYRTSVDESEGYYNNVRIPADQFANYIITVGGTLSPLGESPNIAQYLTQVSFVDDTATIDNIREWSWNGSQSTDAADDPQALTGVTIYRIDGIVESGCNLEIADAREGVDGTVYPSLGDAIRGQIQDTRDMIQPCPVQDVQVNGTSVVDAAGIAHITMPELVKTVNGNPIVIDDAFGEVKNLDVELTPIQEGSGTPSPQNVRPITGHDSVTVRDGGRNMLDPSTITVGAYYNNQMTEVAAPTKAHSGIIAVKPSTSYCLNGYAGQGYYSMLALDADQQPIGAWYGGASKTAPFVATTPANAYYMVLNFNADQINTIAFYESATVDGYIEYYGQSKTVTLPHTVYGAGVGVTSGEGKEKMAMVDLGSLTWTAPANGYPYFYSSRLDDAKGAPVSAVIDNAICSSYPQGKYTDIAVQNPQASGFTIANSTKYVYLYDPALVGKTVAEVKTALSGVQLCYELETPTDLSTTPTDLTLYNGDNVVSSDGDMELTYVQDMAIVIRKIESQL